MKKVNTKNTLAAAFAATVMAISCSASISAYAADATSIQSINGDNAVVNVSEYQEYLDTLTDEQKAIVNAKEQMVAGVSSNEMYGTTRSSTKHGLSRTFTMYQQETDYYCVPACIKSMLTYVTGSSPSQSTIHDYTQLRFSVIPSYVNERQNATKYLLAESPTQSDLTRRIKSDITTWDVPTFIRIENHYGTNWYYGTDGHCILSNGIYDDLSDILIADPLGNRVTGCPYFYEKDASTVARYTTDMCW